MAHKLDPLLRPRSIAVLGATERSGSVGRRTVHNLLAGGFDGKIYPINPGRDAVLGLTCYADFKALPETVEHVIFVVNDYRIEAALQQAIAHGAQAATIMSQLIIEDDSVPLLTERVTRMVRESGLLVCGPNCMGFYNCHDGVWVCGFDTRENHVRGGNVTLISHSGSGMSGIVDCEERINFNLAVSTGQELCVTMSDYMDFAIESHRPRAIGLFMETVRDPEAMTSVLDKARTRKIPVVAIKVGRTELSARLAVSHSGAMAGEDAAYQALFDRYGVQRVDDMDEFTTALIMFAQPHPVADGGLVGLHDSGGERQLHIDLAHQMNVPFARINPQTTNRLKSLLDPGLPAVNPLDAWGAGGADYNQIMEKCLTTMLQDPDAAFGVVVHDRAPQSGIYPEYVNYMRRAHSVTGKPVFLVANRQGTGSDPLVVKTTHEGFPVVDGLRSFLVGARCLLNYHEFCNRPPMELSSLSIDLAVQTRELLTSGVTLDETDSSQLLRDCGLPVNPAIRVDNQAAVIKAAANLGYPVVLKTAEPGISHKTDQQGVCLDIRNKDQLSDTYRDLSNRLGPTVMVAPSIDLQAVEMVLGMVQDQQFGPLIMLGFGGVRVEAIKDVVFVLPPFDVTTAHRLVDSLQQAQLLRRHRNGFTPAVDTARLKLMRSSQSTIPDIPDPEWLIRVTLPPRTWFSRVSNPQTQTPSWQL